MKKHRSAELWDRLGISISGFCAFHCLFFPIAIALLPLWPAAEAIHDWTHPLLFLLIMPTVLFALHDEVKERRIPLFLYSGLIVVGLAWILHDWIGDMGEASVTLGGSVLLVSGHWLNYKQHKQQCKTRLDHEEA